MNLIDLPLDILKNELFYFLDKKSIGRLSQTCKELNSLTFEIHTCEITSLTERYNYGFFNPLFWAASKGYIPLLRKLLEYGSQSKDPKIKERLSWKYYNYFIIQIIYRYGHYPVFEEFLKENSNIPALTFPTQKQLFSFAIGTGNPKFLFYWFKRDFPKLIGKREDEILVQQLLNCTWRSDEEINEETEAIILEMLETFEKRLSPFSFSFSNRNIKGHLIENPKIEVSWLMSGIWVQASLDRPKILQFMFNRISNVPQEIAPQLVESLRFSLHYSSFETTSVYKQNVIIFDRLGSQFFAIAKTLEKEEEANLFSKYEKPETDIFSKFKKLTTFSRISRMLPHTTEPPFQRSSPGDLVVQDRIWLRQLFKY